MRRQWMHSHWIRTVSLLGLFLLISTEHRAVACQLPSGYWEPQACMGPAPTSEELDEIGEAIALAFESEDGEADFAALVDQQRIADIVLNGIELEAEVRKELEETVVPLLDGKRLFSKYRRSILQGNSIVYLRSIERHERPVLLFRSNDPTGSMDYFEVYVERQPASDSLKIVDWYICHRGESLVKIARRNIVSEISKFDPELLRPQIDSPPGTESTPEEQLSEIQWNEELGNHSTVLTLIDALAPEIRSQTHLIDARLRAALQLPEPQRSTEIQTTVEFAHEAGTDSSFVNLQGIYLFMARGEYDDALICIRRLNELVELDPLVFRLELIALEQAEQFDSLPDTLRRTVAAFPQTHPFIVQAMAHAVQRQDEPRFQALLAVGRETPGFDESLLLNNPTAKSWIESNEN